MLATLEGIDGSGKTTVWEALRDHYPSATFTSEPTDTWYGDAVRRSIDSPEADPLAELFLYTADHAAHLANTVRPALDRGELVIADRYIDSRYAYQGASLAGRVDEALNFVQSVHQPWTRPPDVTVYFDIPPSTATARSAGANKFERESFLERVAANYDRLIDDEPDRFVRIDANQSREAVLEATKRALDDRLD